jgi:uncharacterized membrane protein YedE/YeeE
MSAISWADQRIEFQERASKSCGFSKRRYRLIGRNAMPLLDDNFHLSEFRSIDANLVAGSALFSIGWGIAGYCPGPVSASIGFGNPEALWFIPAMLVGIALHRRWARYC